MDEREIVRELARQYAEVSSLPVMKEKEKLYRAVNDLKMIRPVVLMDELPWHELNGDGELTLLCEDPFLRGYEQYMRMMLYKWRHMPADMILPNYMGVWKLGSFGDCGLRIQQNIVPSKDGNSIVSHEFFDTLATEEDVERLHVPTFTPMPDETAANLERAHGLFDGIIPVKLVGPHFSWNPWDDISFARGVKPLLYDLCDEPEKMHRIMEKLLEIATFKLDMMEQYNLLGCPQPLVHCTCGYASCFPDEDHRPDKVVAKQTWGRATAQIFAEVSPAMHEEFEIEYQKRIMGRFGLVYYGCCEPLHNKIDIVAKIPNLRKISITPWADVDVAADKIGSRFVLASKPNPAHVAVANFEPDVVRREITHVLDACRRNGTSVEFVIKDISTAHHNPQNLIAWERTAMETVLNY